MANDVFKMVVEWDMANGDVAQNVLYGYINGGDAADPTDLIEDIKDDILNKFAPWLATLAGEVILRLVRVYAFNVLTGLSVPIGDGIIGQPGADPQNALPGVLPSRRRSNLITGHGVGGFICRLRPQRLWVIPVR